MSKCGINGCKIHKFLSDDVLKLLDKHKVTTWSSGATDDHYGIEFGAKNLKGFLKDYAEWVRSSDRLTGECNTKAEASPNLTQRKEL